MSDRVARREAIAVGLDERHITPPMGVEMAGYAARKGVAEGVHDDLHVRALVVETPDTAVGILSASLIGLDQEIVDYVREEVTRQTDLQGAKVMLAATHTHSGPRVNGEYSGYVREECVKCLVAAWTRREPGRLGVGCGQVEGVGRNRRRLLYGGLPVDPEAGVVKIENAAGEIVGVLYNYACHPTTLGPDSLQITEDWAHFATRTIAEQLNGDAVTLFVNGAQGDINPGYSSGLSAIGAPIPIRTFAYAEKIGARLGRSVLKTLSGIETHATMPVRSVSRHIDLPLRDESPVAVDEAAARERAAQEALEGFGQESDASPVLRHEAEVAAFFARMVHAQARAFAARDWEPSVSVELQSIRLGDAVLTSFPGEAFVEIGLEVKGRSPFHNTLVVGLANGRSGGYLPTRATHGEGDYEVVAAKYREDAGEKLIEETLDQLDQLRASPSSEGQERVGVASDVGC